MKAKRKQELKHDQFVDNVVAWFVKSQKQLTPYKYHLLGGVGVLLVIFIGIAGMQAAEQSKTSQAWSELEAEKKKAADGEDADFGRLAALYKGSQTEPWILYYWAEYSLGKLAEAKTDKDKDAARAKGITALEKLKDGFPRHPIAKRSGIVLAQQYADQQNWDKAISAYRTVLTSESEYVGKSDWPTRLKGRAISMKPSPTTKSSIPVTSLIGVTWPNSAWNDSGPRGIGTEEVGVSLAAADCGFRQQDSGIQQGSGFKIRIQDSRYRILSLA